jgi:hypothetical protein
VALHEAAHEKRTKDRQLSCHCICTG